MDGNEAMAHNITNQTEGENKIWAKRVYQKNRIKQLTEIKECLIEVHGDEAGFRNDLAEIIAAISARIELIKKGDA